MKACTAKSTNHIHVKKRRHRRCAWEATAIVGVRCLPPRRESSAHDVAGSACSRAQRSCCRRKERRASTHCWCPAHFSIEGDRGSPTPYTADATSSSDGACGPSSGPTTFSTGSGTGGAGGASGGIGGGIVRSSLSSAHRKSVAHDPSQRGRDGVANLLVLFALGAEECECARKSLQRL